MSMACHCSHPEKPDRPRGAGFTIIETLVVLAVLSVLLAVLLPAVKGVRNSGRRVEAVGALRQSFTALSLYTMSHDLYYPFFAEPGLPSHPLRIGQTVIQTSPSVHFSRHSTWWPSAIMPFLTAIPSLDGQPAFLHDATHIPPTGREPEVYSSGRLRMSHTAFASPEFWQDSGLFPHRQMVGVRVSQVRHPARKGIIVDLGGPEADDIPPYRYIESPPTAARIAFADGSIDRLPWHSGRNIAPPSQVPFNLMLWVPTMATRDGVKGADN